MNNSITKVCTKCKTEKPLTDFWRSQKGKNGYRSYCKICHQQPNNPERNRRVHLKARYGLTLEMFDELFAKQDNKCAICQISEPNKKINFWNVDHDHNCCSGSFTCGKCIRGILCPGCNTRLGLLESKNGLIWLKNVKMYLMGTDKITDFESSCIPEIAEAVPSVIEGVERGNALPSH